MILPTLATGIAISTYELWRKKKETSAIATVTIIGILLSLPYIPQEWLWRFLLMEFVPIAFIIGYAASKMEKKITIAIFLLLSLSPFILQSVEASKTLRPTIREEDYIELERMSLKIPSNSVVVTTFHIGYWVQYVSRCDISKRPSPDLWQRYAHVLLLFDKFSKKPIRIPKGSIKLFEGERFILFELPLPPKK